VIKLSQKKKLSEFILIKHKDGQLYTLTMCAKTLQPLKVELLANLPSDWTAKDFYDYLDEGRRFDISF